MNKFKKKKNQRMQFANERNYAQMEVARNL